MAWALLGPFPSVCLATGPLVVYKVGWSVCWLSPMSLDEVLRVHLNKSCKDTIQVTWENIIYYSDNYDCINLSLACIYICSGCNYHLIYKYNWVTLDFNNKFNLKELLTVVKKNRYCAQRFCTKCLTSCLFFNTCRIWTIFILIFQIICCGKYSLKVWDFKVFLPFSTVFIFVFLIWLFALIANW